MTDPVGPGTEIHHLPPDDFPPLPPSAEAVLAVIATALNDVYDQAGVLMFWSSPITYLDGKRPCDIWRDRDLPMLERLAQRVNALADGAFA